jgi:hypothetical protein
MDTWLAEIGKKKAGIAKRSEDKKTIPKACVTVFPQDLATLEFHEARIKGMKARGDKFVAAATTVDEKTGASLLQLLASSETMARQHLGAYVLQLKPIAGGGATYTKTSILTSSFRFSGGAVVSYLLLDGQDGSVSRSGTVREYGGFIKSDELQQYLQSTQ